MEKLAGTSQKDEQITTITRKRGVRAYTDRRRTIGRLASAGALVVVAALAVAAPVWGASPVGHDHLTDTFGIDDFCGAGLTVAGTVQVVQNFREDGVDFRTSGSVHQVLTNTENGKSVLLSSAGAFTNTLVSGDPAGVHTYLATVKGLPQKVQTPNGRVLLRDAGVISFLNTFDGDEFVGGELVITKGPHPDADADFELFCQTVVPALT